MIKLGKVGVSLTCDICGEEIDGFDTFDDALDYSREEGWESDIGETLDLTEDYIDICPRCVEKIKNTK